MVVRSVMDETFNLHSVAGTVEDVTDPVVPWVDEGDIGVTGSDGNGRPATPESDEDIAEKVGRWIGLPVTRKADQPRNDRNKERPAKERKPIPPKPRPGALVKQFTDLYVSVGTMMLPFDQPCGTVIIQSAPKCAEALENLARENPAVRRALMALVETSVWGSVLAAHAPILIAVAIHHVPAVRNAAPSMPDREPPQHGSNGSGAT